MKVLVTGATSLLGNAVAVRLAARGDAVRTMQRGASGFPERRGDIVDPATTRAAVEGMDAVVHLAARVAVTGPWEQFHRVNVVGTGNLLDGARAGGVERLVHVSSPSVAHGGRSLVGAAAEPADPATARGHYARSKAMAERLALAASADLPVVAVRPHLVWGPGDTQLVGRIVDRARQGRLALVGSGLALVDTTYLDNAADAIVAALDRAPSLSGRALVVSNGEPRPVAELLGRIAAAAGVPPPRLRVPAALARAGGSVVERVWSRTGRSDDPPMTRFLAEQLATAHWFDQRESRRLLHWAPAVSLEEGFRRLEDWYAARRA